MKTFLNLIKTTISLILGIVSFIFIILYTMLNTTENLISKENIVNTIKNIDIVEIIGEDNKQEVYAILEKAEIPTEYIDVMLEDEKLKETVGEYVALSFEYVLSDKEIPAIDEEELTNALLESFDKVIDEAENHQIEVSTYLSTKDQELIREKIKYYVPEVVAQIPAAQEFIENQISQDENLLEAQRKLEEFNQMIDKIQVIYSYKNMLLIGALLPLLFIIFMKYKKFNFIKWLSFPFVFAAGFLKLIHMFIPYVIDNELSTEASEILHIIEPSIETFLSGINQAFTNCLIVGILFIIIQVVVSLYLKKREKEKIVL